MMHQTTKILTAGPGHVPRMQAIAAAAYADAPAGLDGLPDVIGSIGGDMEAGPAWVAQCDGQVAGFLIACRRDGALKLVNLAVDPAFGGRGLARRLLTRAEQSARQRGLTRLELVTHAGMTATRGMYRHLGWREEQVTEHAVFLSKTL